MADGDLTSNIVLRSRFEKPTGTGLKDILDGLTAIKTLLNEIESKPHRINLEIDDQGLRRLAQQVNLQASQIGQQAAAGLQQGFSRGGGIRIMRRQVDSIDKKGRRTTSITDTSRQRADFSETTTKSTASSTGTQKLDVAESDIFNTITDKNRSRRQRQSIERMVAEDEAKQKKELMDFFRVARQTEGHTIRSFRAQLNADDQFLFDEAVEERRAAKRKRAAEALKSENRTQNKVLSEQQKFDKIAADTAISEMQQEEKRRTAMEAASGARLSGFDLASTQVTTRPGQPDQTRFKYVGDHTGPLTGGVKTSYTTDTRSGAVTLKHQQVESQAIQQRRVLLQQMGRRAAKRAANDEFTQRYREINRQVSQGNLSPLNQEENAAIFADIGNRRQERADRLRAERYNKTRKNFWREQNEERRRIGSEASITSMRASGFRESGSTTRFSRSRNREETTTEFMRGQRVGLGQYEVTVVKVNRATGEMNRRLITGAGAARMMGDSFQHAVEKVALWLSATGLVFTGVRAFEEVVRVVAEVEQGTVLLARVGKNLGDTWKQQFTAAEGIRDRLLEITTATGGNIDESLRAAAVFARAGQNQKQVIESTTAALIASKVAELDVVEAAELLSAAYLQFNLSAVEVLPTLDQLNTLSNRYRVTTEDLLQSISRSGSIIAQQNGRLSELAATTAVTSQVTARSGAEIGNAIKTIASNLGRAETKSMLFEKLGVSTLRADGEAKSYTKTLLDLAIATNRLAASEAASVSTQVAGVRQRNILLAQLKNIVDIIKAENLTIFDDGDSEAAKKYGSAVEELDRNSKTLGASIDRLRGEAIKLSQTLSGPAVDVARDLVTILAGMSAILSAGGGVPAKLAILVGIVAAVVLGLKYLATTLGGVNINLATTAIRMIGTSLAALAMAKSTERAAEAKMRLAIATKSAIVSLVKSYGAYALLAGVIYLLVEAYQAYYESSQRLAQIEKETADAGEKSIAKERRKAEAYTNTADAISSLIREIERLESTGKKGDREAAASYRKDAADLAASAGIPFSGVQGGAGATRQIVEMRRGGIQKEMEISKQNTRRLAELQAQNARRLGRTSKAARDLDFSFRLGPLAPSDADIGGLRSESLRNTLPKFQMGNRFGSSEIDKATRDFATEYLELRKKASGGDTDALADLQKLETMLTSSVGGIDTVYGALKKLGDEYKEALDEGAGFSEELKKEEEILKKLTKRLEEANKLTVEREVRITELTKKLMDYQKEEEFMSGVDSTLTSFMGTDEDFTAIQNKIAETSDIVKQLVADLEDAPPALAKEYLPTLTKQEEFLRRQRQAQQKIRLETALSSTRRDLGNVFGMNEAALDSRRKTLFAENPEKFTGESAGLRDYNTQITATMRNLEDLTTLGKELGGKAAKEQDPAKRDVLLGQQKAVNLEIQEQLNRLADLEVSKAKELFAVEAEIAEARKKSADEAQRALGTLSEEDKLRALAQAKFFKDNPDKVLSVKEQFFADSRSVGLGRQLFGGRFADRLSPDKDPFGSLFKDAGLGGSWALDRAAKEASGFRGGRTDAEVIADARKRAIAASGEADKARTGGFTVKPDYDVNAGSRAFGEDGKANIDMTLRPEMVDLAPLFTEFGKILQEQTNRSIQEARNAARDEMRRHLRSKEPAVQPTE